MRHVKRHERFHCDPSWKAKYDFQLWSPIDAIREESIIFDHFTLRLVLSSITGMEAVPLWLATKHKYPVGQACGILESRTRCSLSTVRLRRLYYRKISILDRLTLRVWMTVRLGICNHFECILGGED